jgi:site-specific DNA-cytosine methylase
VRMLDLFCGRFGWSRAFAARGWECVGVDLVEPPEIPQGCTFIKADILGMGFEDLLWKRKVRRICELYGGYNGYETLGEFDFICASSPCEHFCKGGMACFYPDAPYPATAIRLFNHAREICEASGVPYIMENVRGAEQWVGNAKHHCGPFYLWGSAVPPLMPTGITKGTTNMGNWNHNKQLTPQKSAAVLATIPPELANCVCDYAERILEQKELTR